MHSMVVLVLHDMSRFSEVLSAWHDAGAPAVTILDCLGTREPREQARRDDLPLFPSVRDILLADDMPRTTVFSVVPDDVVDKLTQATVQVMGDLSEPRKGILFVVPVTQVLGLRPPPRRPPS